MTGVVICVISKFVVSGSDDFNIYVWEVPDDWADHDKVLTVGRAFMVLHGHRSIVNQVRFNPETHMLLSAGVEKVIKVGYIIINFESRRQVRNSRRLGFFGQCCVVRLHTRLGIIKFAQTLKQTLKGESSHLSKEVTGMLCTHSTQKLGNGCCASFFSGITIFV